jgi:acetyl esterase
VTEQPVDPDVTALLARLGPPVPVADVTADEMRKGMRDAIDAFTRDAEPIAVHEVVDEVVPGRGGGIPVRVYRPRTPTAVLVYLHGGAWVAGDIDTHEFVTRRFSRDTGATVVSVDYRLLPEHPFPAQFDDSWDAVSWAAGLHPDLPLLVAGDSAGGTLTGCVALRARDEGGPRIDGQVLVYPATDDDLDTPSMLGDTGDPRITRDDLRHHFHRYAPPGTGTPYAYPGQAASLAGLPPAVLVIAGHDRLRSAEEDFARRLREAGVPVTVQLDPELVHGWIDFAPCIPAADRAFTRLTHTVSHLIRTGTTPS